MFHGPGQPRKASRFSNEDLWTMGEVPDNGLGPELLSRASSTLGTADPESQLLRLSRGEALPSIYRRRSEAAAPSSTPSSSPLLGDTQQQLATAARRSTTTSRDSTPHDAQRGSVSGGFPSRRAASNCSSGDEGPSRSERQWSTPLAIDLTAPPLAPEGAVATDAMPLYRARFFQEQSECPLLPIDGRANEIVLMRPGFFSIRLESNSDALTIAKLEIDGAMTRCNFRLMPHQKHTVRETRLDVGQHAVPLTFDPSEAQLMPIETDEDIEMHVGCVRILFFEAYERAATLKWEWDPMHPSEIVCFDYGMLDAFLGAFPALQDLDAVRNLDANGKAQRRNKSVVVHGMADGTRAARSEGTQRSTTHPDDGSSSRADRRLTTASGPSRRAEAAHGRHVERCMRLKSSNAANQQPHSGMASASTGGKTPAGGGQSGSVGAASRTQSAALPPSSSHAVAPGLTNASRQGTTDANGRIYAAGEPSLGHSRSMENPLLRLDMATSRRGGSQDAHQSSAQQHHESVHLQQHHHNNGDASNVPTGNECCQRCRPLFEAERACANDLQAQLRRELERANHRIALLEQEHDRRSRSPSYGEGSDLTFGTRRQSTHYDHREDRHQNKVTHRHAAAAPARVDNTASRLRQQRFAPHSEVHIDPASSGRWDVRTAKEAHTRHDARGPSPRSRSTSPPTAVAAPVGRAVDSGDRILQFAHKIIEEERLRNQSTGGRWEDNAPDDRLWDATTSRRTQS